MSFARPVITRTPLIQNPGRRAPASIQRLDLAAANLPDYRRDNERRDRGRWEHQELAQQKDEGDRQMDAQYPAKRIPLCSGPHESERQIHDEREGDKRSQYPQAIRFQIDDLTLCAALCCQEERRRKNSFVIAFGVGVDNSAISFENSAGSFFRGARLLIVKFQRSLRQTEKFRLQNTYYTISRMSHSIGQPRQAAIVFHLNC